MSKQIKIQKIILRNQWELFEVKDFQTVHKKVNNYKGQ